mmetsp:Transcript_20006/g.46164  ORF Transcript_20006/g.46164 Transcript_20006/m.46164 type:complete len:445 (-) Transcript_20006:353-1687(-)|eukprot:CAMPEP_0119365326 /NCGR_PEP_ID=MMETSP1334-20130426/12260_1 /TAXON_ID=127549 /ORGANISM="Calcidiscus leptoporus, Strain RCC1130" /LENGTH=444 /DNA_ID=CAMNT_0007381279 /DNA_START=93 /DNA_END=1427 /DNA_ORIENTATION=-
MLVYVTLHRHADSAPGQLYALVLPLHGEWLEVSVQPSKVDAAGYGVFPAPRGLLNWSTLDMPVLLPYLGLETVVQDAHSLKVLLRILRGEFECTTVGELKATTGLTYMADGLYVLPTSSLSPKQRLRAQLLGAETQVLQVADGRMGSGGDQQRVSGGGRSLACYVLRSEAQAVLNLDRGRGHLFELLLAHSRGEHTDRHLATHVAHVWRKEEGYVLVNAHPAFAEAVSLTGIVNEPAEREAASMKMLVGYARMLDDDDPLLLRRGLKQPAGAASAWLEAMLPPAGGGPEKTSERMVLYCTTRTHYVSSCELTVDYGIGYSRNYHSGKHRGRGRQLAVPEERIGEHERRTARWPHLPGWFNPHAQPLCRPAFEKTDGELRLCADLPEVVAARRAAFGTPPRLRAEIDAEAARGKRSSEEGSGGVQGLLPFQTTKSKKQRSLLFAK